MAIKMLHMFYHKVSEFVHSRNFGPFSDDLDRDWSPKFETGLNIIIAIVQKV